MELTLGILGAGGHGRVIADTAAVSGRWTQIVFYDDESNVNLISSQWPRIGPLADIDQEICDAAVVGIGDNASRQSIQSGLSNNNIPIATIKHPNAFVSPRASLGKGVVIFAGAQVNVAAEIAEGCIVNTAATVDHDCVLDSFVHISPGAKIAGGVTIGALSWIGIGAVIRENVTIGKDCIVGAGSVVLNDVPDNSTVVGVPALRTLKKKP